MEGCSDDAGFGTRPGEEAGKPFSPSSRLRMPSRSLLCRNHTHSTAAVTQKAQQCRQPASSSTSSLPLSLPLILGTTFRSRRVSLLSRPLRGTLCRGSLHLCDDTQVLFLQVSELCPNQPPSRRWSLPLTLDHSIGWTNLWRLAVVRSGSYHLRMRQLHKKHGPVVRIGPNTLSLDYPDLIKTVYGTDGKWPKAGSTPTGDKQPAR